LAASEVARNGNERVFKQLQIAVQATRLAIKQRNASAVFDSNSRFHSLIIENSGNPFLVITMARLDRLILFYRTALLEASIKDTAVDRYFNHLNLSAQRQEKIAEAIEKRRPDQASDLMRRHLLQSADEMTDLLKQSEGADL